MRTRTLPEAAETIVVMVRGRVLDQIIAGRRQEAEGYKASVRRWAAARGMAVSIWSLHKTRDNSQPLPLACAG